MLGKVLTPAAIRRNAQRAARHRRNPAFNLCRMAKTRAKRFGLPFELTPEDIVVPAVCPVLGITLRVGNGKRTDDSPTLDRITAERGYVRGNIAVISWRANRIKSYGTLKELRALVEWLQSQLSIS